MMHSNGDYDVNDTGGSETVTLIMLKCLIINMLHTVL